MKLSFELIKSTTPTRLQAGIRCPRFHVRWQLAYPSRRVQTIDSPGAKSGIRCALFFCESSGACPLAKYKRAAARPRKVFNPGVGFRNRTDALICRRQKRELVGGKR